MLAAVLALVGLAVGAVLAFVVMRSRGGSASVRSAFADIGGAFAAARETVGEADRIVVFGSFLTVAAAVAATKR